MARIRPNRRLERSRPRGGLGLDLDLKRYGPRPRAAAPDRRVSFRVIRFPTVNAVLLEQDDRVFVRQQVDFHRRRRSRDRPTSHGHRSGRYCGHIANHPEVASLETIEHRFRLACRCARGARASQLTFWRDRVVQLKKRRKNNAYAAVIVSHGRSSMFVIVPFIMHCTTRRDEHRFRFLHRARLTSKTAQRRGIPV